MSIDEILAVDLTYWDHPQNLLRINAGQS